MRDINILINEDHTVDFENDYAGLQEENLQGNIVFHFKNFVDGDARAEVVIGNEDGYILLDKVGETYTMPIKSSLLKDRFILMQLVIDQPGEEEYPVWKSEAFTLKVGYSINATSVIPDEYPGWIEVLDGLKDQVEDAIEQAENVNITSEQLENGVKVITTDKTGHQTITIVPQGPQGEPGVPGAVKFIVVAELPTQDIQTDAIYLVPSQNPSTTDLYDEYMYINNTWELLGQKQITVDLTDYVKNTDYASSSIGGVIKLGTTYATAIGNGLLMAREITYANYPSANDYAFISKKTLENVITGKGLVSNTDYASSGTAGVVKVVDANGFGISNSGALYTSEKTYAQYQSSGGAMAISKTTLENVLTAKIGDIQTLLDNLDSGNGV